jgi:TolB-like protein
MPTFVRFDGFDVDLASGQLRKCGIRIPLREQSFQVLASLLERPGQVVTREDLRRRLWSGEVVVDFDNNLNSAVARLREALGDSADRSRYIETLPKRGYRFLAAVSDDIAARPSTGAVRARVIVLPFINLTGDPGQEYFSDAMTEEVITELSALAPDLGIIARTTAMCYKRVQKDVARIGRELNVDYVVEGGVCPEGDRVAVTAQLIRVNDQTHIAATRYEADVHDIFAVRTRIAEAIVAAIDAPAGRGDVVHARSQVRRSTRIPTVNHAAYNEYIQGRYLLERADPAAMTEAREHLENAIARDPKFALAHDALAELYSYLGYFGFLRPKDAYSIGISHALSAVEIDDTLAEAHAVLAEYHKQLDYNWAAAERQIARALELNPLSPIVRLRHAVAVLMPHNHIAEAVCEIERALEFDPLSALAQTWLGAMLLLGRSYDRAIHAAERLLEIEPESCWAFFVIGSAYRQKYVDVCAAGDRRPDFAEGAIRALQRAVDLSPGSLCFLGWLGLALGVCGREAEARALLHQLQQCTRYNLPTGPGFIHLALGEVDAAFECFDRAIEERDQIMMPILSYAHFDPIRGDRRFAALVHKMKLA